MAHKTFISYKYSESRLLRDKIINAMGDDATFYQGETSESPKLTDLKTDRIKAILRDMMYNSSVTIVILSPHLKESKWIDWEISYTLKEITRSSRTSTTNGILGIIMKVNGSYSWIKTMVQGSDGHVFNSYNSYLLYDIINNNRFNQTPKVYACDICKTIDEQMGNYMSFIEEEEFLSNIDKYINNAFDKSEAIENYDIVKE